MPLEVELKTYRQLLPTLLPDEGKFAVIHETKLLGTFTAYEDALKVGYSHCGVQPFLVKRISADEQISHFSRDLGHQCPA